MLDLPPHQKIIPSTCRKLSCLSVCKKSTSSLTFFLKYCKEIADLLFWIIWACLATHTYNDSINLKKPLTFICRQKINFTLHVFIEIAKILQTCYFGCFGHAWLCIPKVILSPCRKLLSLPASKKSTSFPIFFWRYCKDMQTSYFGYFGHIWLHKPKTNSAHF